MAAPNTNVLQDYLQIFESDDLKKVDPISALRALQKHSPKSVALFRTCDAKDDSFVPRLSIIGIQPLETIQCRGKTANPFNLLNEKLKAKSFPPLPSLPFFQGGALGYFSYDSVSFLEPSLLQNKIFSKEQAQFDAELVFYQYYFIFGHLEGKVLILSSEKTSLEKFKELEAIALKSAAEATWSLSDSESIQDLPIDQMKSNLGKNKFLEGIHKLKEHILEGDIFQCVLSDQFSTNFEGDSVRLFEILSAISPAPYQFYFMIEGRVFLGTSPEMLLKSIKNLIETHPIAGTRPRSKNPVEEKRLSEELLNDTKEKSEHLMLVDLARNDIGRVAEPGTVKVESFQKIKKFGGVMHLVSVVTGKLSSKISSIEALASCFPAGTLSGAPKIQAMDLITEIEKKPRGFYGGAFVAASFSGDLDSCISIRGISIENGIATIQAGAGIVADSVPELEYQEVEHKTRLTRKALAIAIELEKRVT